MIHSRVTGIGLPIVFIHGYGEDHSLWNDISPSLSEKYKLITLDLPGFGKSTPIKGPFSLEAVAELVHQHITVVLKIPTYLVFGHSLGGYISLSLAKLFPKAIIGFGLINSTSLADSIEKKENRLKVIDFINKHGGEFFLTSFVPALFTPENQLLLKDKVNSVLAMGANIPQNVLTDYMLAMRDRNDYSGLLKKHENVLFVAGEEDSHFTMQDYSTQLGLLQCPEHGHVFTKTAHMSMFEDQKRLILCILAMLNSVKVTEIRLK